MGTTQERSMLSEKILEATPLKTEVVRPPTTHPTNRGCKTNKICWALQEN